MVAAYADTAAFKCITFCCHFILELIAEPITSHSSTWGKKGIALREWILGSDHCLWHFHHSVTPTRSLGEMKGEEICQLLCWIDFPFATVRDTYRKLVLRSSVMQILFSPTPSHRPAPIRKHYGSARDPVEGQRHIELLWVMKKQIWDRCEHPLKGVRASCYTGCPEEVYH